MGRIGRIARRLGAVHRRRHCPSPSGSSLWMCRRPTLRSFSRLSQRITTSVVLIRARPRRRAGEPDALQRGGLSVLNSGMARCGRQHTLCAHGRHLWVLSTGETVSAKVKASDSVALNLSLLQLSVAASSPTMHVHQLLFEGPDAYARAGGLASGRVARQTVCSAT
jgi:hypothetical protein